MFFRFIIALTLAPALIYGAEKVSYTDHVLPIFEQSCLNCHNPDKTKGGLDLSSYGSTLRGGSGGKVVEAEDLGSSLISAVERSREPIMPPEGDKLPKAQIDVLKQWIKDGLLETKNSKARKAEKPKFAMTVRSDPAAKPDGPPPMPEHLLLEPPVATQHGSAVHDLAASPWAPLIAITGQRQVLLHHAETRELLGILPFPEGDPVSLSFTPDARHLIVGGGTPGKSGLTVTFDITTGTRVLSVGKAFDTILAADLSPGFERVATGDPSRLLKLWDTSTGEQVKSIKKHTDWITTLDISPDGVLLASGGRNGGVWVWETATGNEFHTLRGHQAGITTAEFRADSNLLATASEDGTVRFWEMNGGKEIKKIEAHKGGVTAFSFARNGSFATVGRDRKAKLWKPDFKQARELSKRLPALPISAALSSDGKRAFIGDTVGKIHVINCADGKNLGTIPSNPPTLEARLAQISSKLKELESSNPKKQAATVERLRKSRKHWQAATINSRAIDARKAAAKSSGAIESLQLDFTDAAVAVADQAGALNRKRAERQRFAANLDTSHPDERSATLAAIDIVIECELTKLQKAESELTRISEAITPAAINAHEQQQLAASLTNSYQQTLK